jgi:MFS family permease
MRAGSRSGLWRNRNWRLLWLGQGVSATGDMVFTMTVMLWMATIIAKGQTWAPAAASGALLATAAPVLVVGPLAGVFVDRWDRRRTMLTADAARCALITSLLVLPLLRHSIPVGAQLAILYVVLAICSCFAEFFNPSRLAVLGAIVPPEQQAAASGQLSAAFSTAQVIGPPIAAPLLITFGVQWALILNAASFAFSFGCLRVMRVPDVSEGEAPARAGFFAEFTAGLRYFAGNKVLVTIGVGIVIAMLGLGAVNSLVVFFIPHDLHVAASWIGTVTGSVGAGAIAGALLTGAVTRWVRPGQLFWMSLAGCGVALIGFSRATALGPAIAFAVVLGLAVGVLNAALSPIILAETPSRLLGRVLAVISPLQQLASIVSLVLAGVLASTVLRGLHAVVAGLTFGPYDTVFGIAGLLFVIAGAVSVAPLRAAGKSAARAAADDAAPPVEGTATATPGGDGPAVAASD